MNPKMKTQMVLGYELTLVAGHRYLATRPMLGGDINDDDVLVKLPVTVVDYENQWGDGRPVNGRRIGLLNPRLGRDGFQPAKNRQDQR
ncbi:MAG: hypothetical protein WDN00_19465 [Limisphaerales bacterium]